MKMVSLQNLVEKNTKVAGENKYPVLSITAGVGFVNQAEKFGKEIAGAQYVHYTILGKGDFSYNKGNSNTYPQGCIYRQDEYEKAAVPNVFNSFHFISSEVDTDYYKYLFESGYLNHQLFRLINSGVRDDGLLNLYEDDFYSCKVPCPPLAEQKRIAEILGCCDRVIALKKELIAEKKRQKKALMQKLLNPDSGFRLAGFKGEWHSIRLENCGCWVGGGTPSKQNRDFWENGTIKWISSQEVKTRLLVDTTYKITENAINVSASNLVPKNSLIFVSRSGVLRHSFPVAKIIESMAINQDIKALTPHKTIEIDFFHFLIENKESDIIRNYVTTGTTVESLRFDDFMKMLVDVPSKKEQQAIANILSAADEEIDLLEQELVQQQQKKKSLMQLLLTGIVRV